MIPSTSAAYTTGAPDSEGAWDCATVSAEPRPNAIRRTNLRARGLSRSCLRFHVAPESDAKPSQQIDRQREHDRGVLLGADLDERLKIPQRNRHRLAGQDRRPPSPFRR